MKKLIESLLRDLFAAVIIHAFVAGDRGKGVTQDELAEEAYDFADALMQARKR